MAERKWAMTRIAAGDYLLPSNDAQTLWRLRKYEERDGTLSTGDGKVINGDFWMVLRFAYSDLSGRDEFSAWEDLNDPSLWECVCSMLPTRQAAIDEALSYEQQPASASR